MGNGVGIASFVISLILMVLTFIVLPVMIWRAIASSIYYGGINTTAVAQAATFGIVLLVLSFIGLILGIVGIATAEDNKTFGILGTVFSAICLLVLLGAMGYGFAAVF